MRILLYLYSFLLPGQVQLTTAAAIADVRPTDAPAGAPAGAPTPALPDDDARWMDADAPTWLCCSTPATVAMR